MEVQGHTARTPPCRNSGQVANTCPCLTHFVPGEATTPHGEAITPVLSPASS